MNQNNVPRHGENRRRTEPAPTEFVGGSFVSRSPKNVAGQSRLLDAVALRVDDTGATRAGQSCFTLDDLLQLASSSYCGRRRRP